MAASIWNKRDASSNEVAIADVYLYLLVYTSNTMNTVIPGQYKCLMTKCKHYTKTCHLEVYVPLR
jgi:hypothetical protein